MDTEIAPDESCLNPERRMLTRLLSFDKTVVRAKASALYDDQGIEYVDFSSQYGAVPFGYNPEFLWDALAGVRERQEPSFVQPLVAPAAERLAKMLSDCTPGGRRYCIFTNSGAESVEAAIKTARAKTQRATVLATHTGFHGKTLGAASATGNPIYRSPFLADTQAFEHIPFDDLEALSKRLAKEDVAAFIVEPIQGEGGIVVPAPGYLARAHELCRAHGTLFVVDEVQSGLGRTGRLFAYEWDNCSPDIILVAKGLGGGLVPLGACLVAEHAWTSGMGLHHSSTFANNHLTCSVGARVLERLLEDEQAFVRDVETRGEYLGSKLSELVHRYPTVFAAARGKGLLQGLELQPWSSEEAYFLGYARQLGYQVPLVCGYLLNVHKILVLPTIARSNVLRIQPALTVSREDIDKLITALDEVARLIGGDRFDLLISYATGGRVEPSAVPSRPLPAPVIVPATEEMCLGRFAFLIHPTDFDDIMRCMPQGCDAYPPEQRQKLAIWMDMLRRLEMSPTALYHTPCIRSRQGGYVSGWLISSLLTPKELLRLAPRERRKLASEWLGTARGVGCDIIGLGAFTSVITRGGTDIADSPTPITTGNSLTALMCAEALRKVAQQRGRSLRDQTVAVIGAGGAVGRLAALDLAPHCRRLTLCGNRMNPVAVRDVQAVAGEIYQRLLALRDDEIHGDMSSDIRLIRLSLTDDLADLPDQEPEARRRALVSRIEEMFRMRLHREPPITVSIDVERTLRESTAILSATSNGNAFLDAACIAPGAIVCDAARPGDLARDVGEARPDVFAMEGGLVRLPEEIRFGRNNVLGFPPGINLACLSETIALAMSGARRHYSLGNRIPYAEALEVYETALAHGFQCFVPPSVGAASLIQRAG